MSISGLTAADWQAPPREPQGILFSNVKTLAAVVVTWAIVSVITTTTAFIAIRGSDITTWLQIFGPMVSYYSVWIVISLLIYRIVEILNGTRSRQIVAAAAHVALFVAVTLSLPFIVHIDDWRTWLYGERAPGFHALAAVIYILNLGGCLLIRFYRLSVTRDRDARDARLRSSLLENQLNLARMDALKMQINPHFLFNALNSIAALIETDRKVEAYHATELLGGLLRSALEQSGERMLALEQELDFVERYVNLEKVRFGSRINFRMDVDDNLRQAEVPALILQPLIENSIKHAVNGSPGEVAIVLEVRDDGDELVIELTDNGPGIPAVRETAGGVGIRNVRERLGLIYEGVASLDVLGRTGGGVVSRLRLPWSPAQSLP